MTTTVIYDENILASVMAAACAASLKDFKAVESKSIVHRLTDKYVWIGVIPTYDHFSCEKAVVDTREHVCIADFNMASQTKDLIKKVEYRYGGDPAKTNVAEIEGYGKRTLLVRALMYFELSPARLSALTLAVEEFYGYSTPLEQLQNMSLNVKEALLCLETNTKYNYIPLTEESRECGEDAWNELKAFSDKATADRFVLKNLTLKKDRRSTPLYTFCEPKHWWFIQRWLMFGGVSFRNFSVSLTGASIHSNLDYVEDLKHYNPTSTLWVA